MGQLFECLYINSPTNSDNYINIALFVSTGGSQSRFHEIFEFKTLQRETGSTKKESYFRIFLNEQLSLCKTYTMAT